MQKTCKQCGKPFEAQRKHATYCSGTCRAWASQGKAPVVVAALPAVEPAGRLVASTLATLEALDRVEHPLGALALVLATEVESQSTPAGAKAGLAKQLRDTLDAAASGAKVLADPMDELGKRRRERHGA